MHSPSEEQSRTLLERVLGLAGQRLSGTAAEEARVFLAHYYDQVDAADLSSRPVEDLYGAGLAHLGLGRRFAAGSPKVRVYNPRPDEHGWSSPHTVIEIVNDDMPFLVDSVAMELNRLGYGVHLLVHPVFATRRGADGALEAIAATGLAHAESYLHVEVDRESDPERLKSLGTRLLSVLTDVRAAVEDWKPMQERMRRIAAEIQAPIPGIDPAEAAEVREFLEWAAAGHFTLLGARDYDLASAEGEDRLMMVADSGLGVLREPRQGGASRSFAELPPAIRALARAPRLLVLTKANTRATVHRPGYLDYIGVKRFDAQGRVTGERRFVGLYTSSAYHADPRTIPLLRRKVAAVEARAGFPAGGHAQKNLLMVLHNYPRDELIQLDEETLLEIGLGILRLGDRRRTRVFIRRDVYGRFYSCLVFLPRDSYNTDARVKIQDVLKRHLGGASAEFTVQVSDAVLARIHLLVRTNPRDEASFDVAAIEADIVRAIRRWDDDFKTALVESLGEERGVAALRAYAGAFPVAYRESVSPPAAVRDVAAMAGLSAAGEFALNLYRPAESDASTLRLRVCRLGVPVPLSASLPVLENLGLEVLDEISFRVERRLAGEAREVSVVHLHDFGLRSHRPIPDVEAIKARTEEALARVTRGEVENDGFNRLTPLAALAADDVIVIRAYAKYLRQAGFTFSQSYVEDTLAAHAGIAAKLVELFHARFAPDRAAGRVDAERQIGARIESALDGVSNLDEDRILRRLLHVIQATLRTNHWVAGADGRRKPYLSLKLESARVPELPEPRPLFEVFVYSARFEAIHLRGGKVARGGLRWSDRPEDFRTEILGLMKAQMVKNAVIVPVGSKGGFVLKKAPPASDREAHLKEGVACYRDFLRGLLDLTDNRVGTEVVPPRSVVRHDPDDPYLVVAADKGTATFSDIANGVAAEYGFWLGDAFASGGSVGYDHKKMGITARGAWESVKRHFREMGVDIQSQDFTVAGIGDMSGDVFGNGMLLSRHIRLVAAFDHRHIVLDPDPDCARSFRERERLFALPRSSWEDYDKALLSKGGGIYPRGAKSIAVSPEAAACLGVEAGAFTPQELLRAILMAPVDLLYNGGIGTYVKASSQTNAEAGDRANDAIRVNGAQLRCRVVAEGGNLGFTQLGRIEFALAGAGGQGGRICTDAIDNSAGVDCSDHEVNIKILLGLVSAEGALTLEQRNTLLAEMTDEVGQLVLADNYFQTQSLAVSGVRGDKLLDGQAAFIRALEKAGRLNRTVEYLPSDDELAERRADKAGLTTPERAVLLAYSKMALFDALLASTLIEDPYVGQAATDYFPRALQERHPAAIAKHPLKREIVATVVANTMINRTGSIFVHRMQEETGAGAEDIVRAFILVRDIFGLEALWREIDALDNRVDTALQSGMLIDVGRVVIRATLWFLRRRRERLTIAQVLEIFRPALAAVQERLPAALSAADRSAWRAHADRLIAGGVAAPLAERLAGLDASYASLDITEVAQDQDKPIASVAALYYALVGDLELRWFWERISALPTDTPWQALARNALRDDLSSQQRALTQAVAKLSARETDPAVLLAAWKERYAPAISRLRAMTEELKRGGVTLDLAVLSVLLRELRALA